MEQANRPGALAGVRVLDLTGETGDACGRVLADLGAEVIKVEPPGGDEGRRGGWAGHNADGISYDWIAYNLNKRATALDLASAPGRQQFIELVATADCVIESFAPGHLERLGLGYDVLRTTNPGLVLTSITPFGQSGPGHATPATDLTLLAEGGVIATQGDAARPPLRMSYPQVRLWAGLHAAVGTLLALTSARNSGAGHHVDVPMLETAPWFMIASPERARTPGVPSRRGVYRAMGQARMPQVLRCADGYVNYSINAGPIAAAAQTKLVQWMDREGLCPDWLRDFDFATWNGSETPAEFGTNFEEALLAFFATKTKRELAQFALENGLFLAPSHSITEVLSEPPYGDDPDMWWTVQDGDRALRVPGPWIEMSATPLALRRRAPGVGEHTQHVMDSAASATKVPNRLQSDGPGTPARLPLSGMLVVELTRVITGPAIGRVLADYGATVVRVQSGHHPDLGGSALGSADPGASSPGSGKWNFNKKSLTLNLKTDQGREIFEELLSQADVFIENNAGGAIDRLGYGYEQVRALNPGVVMLSTSMFIGNGPWSRFRGYGNQTAALAGFQALIGYEGEEAPGAMPGPYTDFSSPPLAVSAILAALLHRANTGEGQYIRQGQGQSVLLMIAGLLLGHQANGVGDTYENFGNSDLRMTPHGCFQCGDGEWIAVAVRDKEDWRALCEVAGWADLTSPELDEIEERRHRSTEISTRIEEWAGARSSADAVMALRNAGIPVGLVLEPDQLLAHPQFQHLQSWERVSPEGGNEFTVANLPYHISGIRPRHWRAPVAPGEDTYDVLTNLVGIAPEAISDLYRRGVLD